MTALGGGWLKNGYRVGKDSCSWAKGTNSVSPLTGGRDGELVASVIEPERGRQINIQREGEL